MGPRKHGCRAPLASSLISSITSMGSQGPPSVQSAGQVHCVPTVHELGKANARDTSQGHCLQGALSVASGKPP